MFLSIVIFSCIVKTKTFTITVFLRYARLDKNYRHIHFLLLGEYMTYIFILLCFILYDKFISCYIYFRFAKSIWNLFSNLFGYRMQVIWDKTRLRLAYLFLLRIVHPILYYIPSFLSTFMMAALYVDLAFFMISRNISRQCFIFLRYSPKTHKFKVMLLKGMYDIVMNLILNMMS